MKDDGRKAPRLAHVIIRCRRRMRSPHFACADWPVLVVPEDELPPLADAEVLGPTITLVRTS